MKGLACYMLLCVCVCEGGGGCMLYALVCVCVCEGGGGCMLYALVCVGGGVTCFMLLCEGVSMLYALVRGLACYMLL